MNSLVQLSEKRRFTRVPFVSHIDLYHNEQHQQGTVVDISFNGVLISSSSLANLQDNTDIEATIHFENDSKISAHMVLAHQNSGFYGFEFTQIDSDGLTHLRNIISRNLDNNQACEREILSLFSYHQ